MPAVVVVAGLLAACDDNLPTITLLTQMEVLGARVEVVGDEQRSSPAPGEEITYEPFVVFPERDPDRTGLAMMVIACTAPDRFLGVPICQEIIDAAQAQLAGEAPMDLPMDELSDSVFPCDGDVVMEAGTLGLYCKFGEPRVSVPIPLEAQGPARLMRGVLCNRGTPVLDPADPDLFRCDGEEGDEDVEEVPFYSTVKLARSEDEQNHHPDPAALTLRIDGEAWPAWGDDEGVPAADACDAGSDMLPVVGFGEEATVDVRYDPDARENDGDEPEVVELSVFANAGELERRYTVFKPDDPIVSGSLRADFTWTAPSMAQNDAYKRREAGDPVHFFVTLADRRGGFSVREWYLCVRNIAEE